MKPLNENNPEAYKTFLSMEVVNAATFETDKKSYYNGIISSLFLAALNDVPLNVSLKFEDNDFSVRMALDTFVHNLKANTQFEDQIWEYVHDINVLDESDDKQLNGLSIIFFVSQAFMTQKVENN